MNFAALMRIGSLEILGGLVAFGVIAARLRPASALPARKAEAMDLALSVHDASGGPVGRDRRVALQVGQGEPAVLGRSGQAEVGLLDPEVSRRHARFDLDGGVLYLSDCGSSNGTFLNGKRIGNEGIEVRAGDHIDVGNTRITITRTEPTSWT